MEGGVGRGCCGVDRGCGEGVLGMICGVWEGCVGDGLWGGGRVLGMIRGVWEGGVGDGLWGVGGGCWGLLDIGVPGG